MSAHPSPTASTSQQATPAPAAAAPRTKSKVYGSQLAKEGDVQKYKAKYKDLKMKVKEIEKDNDKLLLKIQKAKRNIQRVRLERALIYERLLLNPEPAPPAEQDDPVTGEPIHPPPLESFFPVAPAPEDHQQLQEGQHLEHEQQQQQHYADGGIMPEAEASAGMGGLENGMGLEMENGHGNGDGHEIYGGEQGVKMEQS